MESNQDKNNICRTEHHLLFSAAETLIHDLRNCESRIEPLGDVQYIHHNQLGERAVELSLQLDAVLRLTENEYYPSALALLRTSLEHRLFDRLLFLADRFEQEVTGIDESTWQRWQTQKPKDVLEWERKGKDRVKIVWSGLQVRKENTSEVEYSLSIYYHYLTEYDPFAISGDEFEDIAAGHPMHKEQSSQFAKLQRHLWYKALSWTNLTRNLLLNNLASKKEVMQLETHYRFLSAFSHPVSERAWNSIYGHNRPLEIPRYDHYASELSLLYICYLATSELRDFHNMCLRPPAVILHNHDEIEERIKQSEQLISYFWPPGSEPYYYDRVKEANQRYFDAVTENQPRNVIDPRTLKNDEIRYYSDPLSRLIDLHRGFNEITTGLQFVSPWPRKDALYR